MKTVELNPVQWTTEERQQFLDRGFRARREDEFPPVSAFVRPDDYDNDCERGTVDYDPNFRNYSFHRVRVKPETEIRNCNFAQIAPDTPAIECDGLLVFIDCNLTNCRLDSRWLVINGTTAQAWLVKERTADGERETRLFICSHPRELKGDETPPVNVILARDF